MAWNLLEFVPGFGTAKAERESAEADAKLEALNRNQLNSGKLSMQTYEEMQRNIERGRIVDAPGQVSEAFWDGWDEGADNIRDFTGSVINTAVGTPLKLIPWQIWLGLGLWAAWKLGLFGKWKP